MLLHRRLDAEHIARIHNARIKLESQVDVGTTITVTFPTAS